MTAVPRRWTPDAEDVRLLAHLADGATVSAAARQLRMSERTARRRLHRLAQELGVATSMEVVVRAVRDGLV